jgi:hypothetical protein
VHFGANSAQVNLATPNPDTQGVYAATENGKLSVVIVNKNPDTPITFALANMPFGSYFVRHFGREAGIAKWQVRTWLFVIAMTDLFRATRQMSPSAQSTILSFLLILPFSSNKINGYSASVSRPWY